MLRGTLGLHNQVACVESRIVWEIACTETQETTRTRKHKPMAVYSYSRTSEIEELDAAPPGDGVLCHELQQLRIFAHSHGMQPDQCVVDAGVRWAQDFAERPEAARLLEGLQPGDVVLAHSLLRIFSTCEDLERSVRLLRRKRVRLYIADLGGDICDD